MAILKIRDDKGVITNIAAIRGENGKSPIIKNGTWWTYDDELEDYIDTGLGAEKESIVTKANVEKVLTGTIDSHNHDNVYVKEAPSDSKQYVRYNGKWSAIDLSSVNPYDASWALNNTATQDQINELVDALNNKRRITIESIDPDIVSDGNDNIYIGITSQAENSFISIYINKSTGNITYGYRMLPALDDVESIKVRAIDHIPTEDDIEFEYLYSNKTMPYTVGSTVYYNNKFYRLNSIVDGKADWRELVDANSTITEISKEDINYITSIEPGTTLTDEQYNKLINIISGQVAFNILEVGILAYVYKSENEDDLVLSIAYYSPYNVCMNLYINKITKVVAFISQDINRIHSSPDGLYIYSEARKINDTNTELYVFNALLINKGDGTKYLADNGKYQTVIVPTKTSELTNDSGYLVNSDIANLATKDEVSTKVDKVSGKGLSTNDYTTDEKNKLAGIAAGAEVNVNADWNATSGDAMIINKPMIPSKTSQLTNDSGYITSSAVDTKISSAIASVYRVKGTVSNYGSLPTSNVTIGDVYNLSDTGANYVCTSTSPITWDKLSETVDLSAYSTTAENDAKYQVKGNYITSIPTASSGTLGGIKTGYSTSSSNKNYAVQLDSSNNAYVNVPWTDINTTYSQATSSSLGLVKIGYSTSGKNYAVQLDSDGKMYTNVPWTDNDTTYSAGTGISLSGTTFSNSGVRSVTAGSSSNQLSVNTGGTTSTITINNVANATNATTATSANKLSTARNISLSGFVTGSTSFDGSKDVTINTTINSNGDGSKYLNDAGKYSDPCPHIKVMSEELYNAIVNVTSSIESTKTEAITYLSNNIAENTKTIYIKNNITATDDMMFLSEYCIIVRYSPYNDPNIKDRDAIYISFSNIYAWMQPDYYPVYRNVISVNLLDNTVSSLGSALIFSPEGTAAYMGINNETEYSYNLISNINIFDAMFNQYNSVTTLTSLPTDRYSIQAKVTAATTLSFLGTPKNGMEYMIDILNNSSSDIIQSLPNTDPYQSNVDSITLPAGKVTSISVRYVFNKYIIKV